jgi:VWFA-related protein
MRVVNSAFVCFCLALALSAQELQHEVRVVNIEVPVRVFQGGSFVDDLKLDDFELYEDGILQKIESVFLVKKTSIEREEGRGEEEPKVQRTFVFLFQMTDYMPEIEGALDYFFERVLSAGDSLIVITPVKTYNLRNDVLDQMPRDRIKDQLAGILRSDIVLGGTEYRNLIRELEESAPTTPEALQYYSQLLDRLESLRAIDQKKLQEFSKFLGGRPGQKHVYLFYQKEVVPKLHPRVRIELDSMNQEQSSFVMDLIEVFEHFKREISFDVDLVKKDFSDSSMAVHLLYITKTPAMSTAMTRLNPSGMVMAEKAEDIFSAFREVARATGGLTESAADAGVAFRKAAVATENYYLLYYKPPDRKTDERFREIEVKVKRDGATVTHRAGYFAD